MSTKRLNVPEHECAHMTDWPGKWHSKEPVQRGSGLINDHGMLVLVGDNGEEYLWFETGDNVSTEVRA